MFYKEISNSAAVDVLKTKMSAAADAIQILVSEGYIQKKRKSIILSWTNIMIQAYANFDILSEEQQSKLNRLYNRLLNL